MGIMTEDSIIIRLTNQNDCSCIYDIERAASLFPWSYDAIANELANPYGLSLIAQAVENTAAGFLFSAIIADEVCIHNFAVHPRFQRRGVGTYLLKTTLDMARSRGACKAFLEVRSKNIPAIGLYKQLGFIVSSIRKHYYSGDCDDALIMHKPINTES
jgi:ribosomal-protein-alanine N-acetyltransferase